MGASVRAAAETSAAVGAVLVVPKRAAAAVRVVEKRATVAVADPHSFNSLHSHSLRRLQVFSEITFSKKEVV